MLRLAVAWLCLLLPTPLLAEWQVATAPHFRLHGDLPQAELAARARVLEDFHGLLARTTGRDLPAGAPPLDVFLVSKLADATPWRRMPDGIAGFYRADTGRISAVALADGTGGQTGLTSQQLLLHEYAHHFLLGSGRFAYPAWYVEGFAEYFATARFTEGRIDVGAPAAARATALRDGAWLPIERLLARDPRVARSGNGRMFYAQSWLLAHYMFRAPGMRDKLTAYLKAHASGEDPVAAFRRTIDPDLRGFEQTLRRYADGGANGSSLDRPSMQPALIDIEPLSQAAGALLLRKVALEHGAVSGRGHAARAEVRAIALRFPGDPLAQRTVALAELHHGSPAEAAKLLDRLLDAAPRDPDLLRWRAQAARATRTPEGQEAARRYLVRASDAAPADWRTLHAYARLYRRADAPLPAEVLPVLLRAYALAPQVTEVVLDTALALSKAGRLDKAAAVLEPLAFAPHGGPAAELAERMLARARAGDQAGFLAEISAARRPATARIAAVQR